VGAPRYQGDKYFNSVFAFDDSGKLSGVYDKQRLVAFGEYLPLRFITYPFLAATKMYGSDYFPGKGRGVIELAGQRLGMMVCFESTMPEIARHRINAGATFLLTLTNDAWFGSSFALNQHLQAGILRAVENEVYLVQAANTGISAFIDGVGRVKDKSEVNRAQFLIGEVRPRSALASPTFYARHGEMLVLVCGVFLFVLLVGRLVFMEKA
jgi:apolipoprotein N-acyltransferase